MYPNQNFWNIGKLRIKMQNFKRKNMPSLEVSLKEMVINGKTAKFIFDTLLLEFGTSPTLKAIQKRITYFKNKVPVPFNEVSRQNFNRNCNVEDFHESVEDDPVVNEPLNANVDVDVSESINALQLMNHLDQEEPLPEKQPSIENGVEDFHESVENDQVQIQQSVVNQEEPVPEKQPSIDNPMNVEDFPTINQEDSWYPITTMEEDYDVMEDNFPPALNDENFFNDLSAKDLSVVSGSPTDCYFYNGLAFPKWSRNFCWLHSGMMFLIHVFPIDLFSDGNLFKIIKRVRNSNLLLHELEIKQLDEITLQEGIHLFHGEMKSFLSWVKKDDFGFNNPHWLGTKFMKIIDSNAFRLPFADYE
jgi:hypothetical protein